MNTRSYWLSKRFSDPKRYPYGLSRSGDFTISQSQLLESQGNLIQALLRDEVADPTQEDMALKKAIQAGDIQFNNLASTWIKYASTHHEKISVSSSAKSEETVDDDWIDEDELEELDELD